MTYRKICIVGPGAIGGMIAVLMKNAGADVSALARPAKAAAIQANGLTLALADRTITERMTASSDPRDLGLQDLVVVTLKGNALLSMADKIIALCRSETPVVFVMNGLPWWFFDGFGGALAGMRIKAVDPDGVLASTFAADRTVWGVINCSVIERADGVIEHTRNKNLILGQPGGVAGLEGIAEVFRAAGYEVSIAENIREKIWAKLVVNVSGNPVSALTGALLQDMYDDPLVRECVGAIADEVRALGAHLGFGAGGSPIEAMKGSPVRSSMLQDLERGRALELGSIVEAVVEIGEAAGVPLPQTRAILGLTRLRAATAGLS